jgi:uncharacterized membrane protein
MLTQDRWLRRLEWALHAMPAKDRDEITREACSHIEDRLAQGNAIADVLAALGTPEEHAHGFFEEFELSEALGSRTTTGMLRIAARRIHRSAAAAVAFTLVCCLFVLGVGIVLTALMHFIDPLHWGVWYSTHMFLIGYVDNPGEARELLGAWIYPGAVLLAYGCWNIGQIILLWALRTMTRR